MRSQGEVQPEGVVKRAEDLWRKRADGWADTFDGDRADLLGLRLGVELHR